MKKGLLAGIMLALAVTACKKPVPPPLYMAVAVSRRDIVVSAEAAGAVEAITVVNVKSRASGTILRMPAQTGMRARIGDTLVIVDKRDPTNSFNQAQSDLAVARANVQNAESNKTRIDAMFTGQLASAQEHEAANLQYSTAQSQLVRAQIQLQQASDALSDCNVLASINGVILTKGVDVGTVIASAVNQVSGGTTLLTMANLDTVQLRVQVDETDIGKISQGELADITVDAFPNRPFHGQVLKIEPQSTVNNNVTMFPVLIWIPNLDPNAMLLPGMNAEVQIHVASTSNVLAIPNAALRTQRDVSSAAQVLGLNPSDVQRTLAMADSASRGNGQGSMAGRTPLAQGSDSGLRGGQRSGRQQPQQQAAAPAPAPAPAPPAPSASVPGQVPGQGQRPPLPSFATQDQIDAIRAKRRSGEALTPAESTLSARVRDYYAQMGFGRGGNGGNGGNGGQPAAPGAPQAAPQQDAAQAGGASMDAVRAAFQKRQAGQPLTPAEQALIQQAMSRMGGGGGGRGGPPRANNNFMFGGSYIVFVMRGGKPTPVRVRTGVTDLDYSEVKSGLTDQDTVLLLPSASLVQSQQDMKDRFQRMTGGGGVPGMAQQTPRPTGTATPTAPGRGN